MKVKATSVELVPLDDERAWDLLPTDHTLHYYDRDSTGRPQFRHAAVADTVAACPAMYLEPGVIMSSGATAMCCRDGDGDHGYGSAFEDGFHTVWNGTSMRSARRRFRDVEQRPEMCRGCPIIAVDSLQLDTTRAEAET